MKPDITTATMLDVLDEAQWKRSGIDLSSYSEQSVRNAYQALPVEQQQLLQRVSHLGRPLQNL